MKLNRTVSFDGTPVFRGIALMLNDARKHGWHGRLNAADRRKGVAEKYGKLSQAALYAGWLAHKAGFNPANPPGRSTHELRSDGKAYRGPVGRPLAWWQLGLDVSDPENLLRVLKRLGYGVKRPYVTEAWHFNLTRNPRLRLRRRGIVKRLRRLPVIEPTRISPAGVEFIGGFEGFRPVPYNDPAGFATIGFGHLIARRNVLPSDSKVTYGGFKPPLTRKQGLALLAVDLDRFEEGVRTAVKVPLTQNQFDALVSFAYNCGLQSLQSSTLLKKLNSNDYQGAAGEFMRWTKAGGKPLPGLVRRRQAERDLFLK